MFDNGPEGAAAKLQQIKAASPPSGPVPDEAFQQAMAMAQAFLPSAASSGTSREDSAAKGHPTSPEPSSSSQARQLDL